MLPAPERVTRGSLFQRAYTGRKSISMPLVTLYVLPRLKATGGGRGAGAKMPLVGFVVAKKVSNSACVRNRVKRRLREAYRLLRRSDAVAALSLSQWYALVWVIHDKAIGASWEGIQQTVTDCLAKASVRYGAGARAQKGPVTSQALSQPKPAGEKDAKPT